jgi:hypothetical protein
MSLAGYVALAGSTLIVFMVAVVLGLVELDRRTARQQQPELPRRTVLGPTRWEG